MWTDNLEGLSRVQAAYNGRLSPCPEIFSTWWGFCTRHRPTRNSGARSWIGWRVRHPDYGGYQVPERVGRMRIVSRRFVRHAHASGLKVQVWTVDDEADMRRLLSWGVDGLISNRPDVAVRVRNAIAEL